jgi:glycerophosphoryl diester phosphodiesterase
MKTTGYLGPHPETRPRIFAHRGLTFERGIQVADENTIAAFDLALAAGADYLESDIQVTKDQIPVLFHDGDLKRLLGKRTLVSDLTLAEVKQIRLPRQGAIPTLAEALERFPAAKFNLDIKNPKAEAVGIQTILELAATERVLVSSFSERSRKRALARTTSPLASSAGSSKVLATYLAAIANQNSSVEKQLASIDALQVPTRRYGIDFTHPKFLELVLASGVELHYWTINEPSQMVELFQLGAHGIVTDRTELAIQTFC